MWCELCKTSENEELYNFRESSFTFDGQSIKFTDISSMEIQNRCNKVCQLCLLRLSTKFQVRREQEASEPQSEEQNDDHYFVEGMGKLMGSDKVYCQNCVSCEVTTEFFDMRQTSFNFAGRKISFFNCFTFCIGVELDEDCVYLCHKCMLAFKMDYIEKQTKLPPSGCQKQTIDKLATGVRPVILDLVKIEVIPEPNLLVSQEQIDDLTEETEKPLRKKKEKPAKKVQKTKSKVKLCIPVVEVVKKVKNEKLPPEKTEKNDYYYAKQRDNPNNEFYDSINPAELVEVKQEPLDVEPPHIDIEVIEAAVKIEPELIIDNQPNYCEDDFDDPDEFSGEYRDTANVLVGFRVSVQDTQPSNSKVIQPKRSYESGLQMFDQTYRDQNIKTRFECKYCPIHFQRKALLTAHVDAFHLYQLNEKFTLFTDYLIKHTVGDSVLYQCSECQPLLSFDSYHEFKRHVYFLHCPEYTFEIQCCEACDAIFDKHHAKLKHWTLYHAARTSEPMLYNGKPMDRL